MLGVQPVPGLCVEPLRCFKHRSTVHSSPATRRRALGFAPRQSDRQILPRAAPRFASARPGRPAQATRRAPQRQQRRAVAAQGGAQPAAHPPLEKLREGPTAADLWGRRSPGRARARVAAVEFTKSVLAADPARAVVRAVSSPHRQTLTLQEVPMIALLASQFGSSCAGVGASAISVRSVSAWRARGAG